MEGGLYSTSFYKSAGVRDTNYMILVPSLDGLIAAIKAMARSIPENAKSFDFFFKEENGSFISFEFILDTGGRIDSWSYQGKVASQNPQCSRFTVNGKIFFDGLVESIESELKYLVDDFKRRGESPSWENHGRKVQF